MSGLLRSLAPRRRSPAVLLKALNDKLIERKVESRYVALLLMLWHPHSGELSMANAGALPPMICRAGEMTEAAGGGRAPRLAGGHASTRRPRSRPSPAIRSCFTPTASPIN